MQEQDKKILWALQALCAGREYCSSDVMGKAMKMTRGDTGLSEKILEELKKEGYVNDSRYARAFSKDRSSLAGWGPVKIRYSLRRKGIDERMISEALDALDSVEGAEKMERILTEKLRSLDMDDPKSRGKLVRFALSRGYPYDDVMDFMSRISIDG